MAPFERGIGGIFEGWTGATCTHLEAWEGRRLARPVKMVILDGSVRPELRRQGTPRLSLPLVLARRGIGSAQPTPAEPTPAEEAWHSFLPSCSCNSDIPVHSLSAGCPSGSVTPRNRSFFVHGTMFRSPFVA